MLEKLSFTLRHHYLQRSRSAKEISMNPKKPPSLEPFDHVEYDTIRGPLNAFKKSELINSGTLITGHPKIDFVVLRGATLSLFV